MGDKLTPSDVYVSLCPPPPPASVPLHEAGVIIIVDVDAIDDVVVVVEPTELSVFQGQL